MRDARYEPFSGAVAADSDPDDAVCRQSFAERIVADLRVALMSGAYEPGARLNIRQLAAAYETSQTPVREAIIQLVADGALEFRRGHHPRVPLLSIERYIDIRETRVPLERLAAELCVANITEDDIDRLALHHGSFLAAERAQDWKGALAANQAFHFGIYEKSNNKVLVRVIENLWLIAGPFVNNQYPYTREPVFDVHPHELILDALRRRSPAEAGDLVVRDLRDGSYRMLEKLRSQMRGAMAES